MTAEELKTILDQRFKGKRFDQTSIASGVISVIRNAVSKVSSARISEFDWVIDHQRFKFTYLKKILCIIDVKKVRSDPKRGLDRTHYDWWCGEFQVYISTESGMDSTIEERLREIELGEAAEEIEERDQADFNASLVKGLKQSGVTGKQMIAVAKYILIHEKEIEKI